MSDNLIPSPEHFVLMRNALDHIARTARKSRTSTRRLRWIEKRAELAAAGGPYSQEAFDLPRIVDPDSETALQARQRAAHAESERDELVQAAIAVESWWQEFGAAQPYSAAIENAEWGVFQKLRVAVSKATGATP